MDSWNEMVTDGEIALVGSDIIINTAGLPAKKGFSFRTCINKTIINQM